jgi:hypothetical protein
MMPNYSRDITICTDSDFCGVIGKGVIQQNAQNVKALHAVLAH